MTALLIVGLVMGIYGGMLVATILTAKILGMFLDA
jgi:hypothetical protein